MKTLTESNWSQWNEMFWNESYFFTTKDHFTFLRMRRPSKEIILEVVFFDWLQFGFLKFYVMGSPEIHLYGIAHVKVDFIPLPKRYVTLSLERFVWTTRFVQCELSSAPWKVYPSPPIMTGDSSFTVVKMCKIIVLLNF